MSDCDLKSPTHMLVTICDATIDVEAMLQGPDDVEALIDRLRHAASFHWPVSAADPLADDPHAPAVDYDAQTFLANTSFPVPCETLAHLVRAKLSPPERRLISRRQAEVVALRRLPLALDDIARALGGMSRSAVTQHLTGARKAGVVIPNDRVLAPVAPAVSHETRALEKWEISPVRVAEIVAEQLSDDEFERLTARQSEAVALRRAGLSLARAATAMRLTSTGAVANLIREARGRGVAVGERAAT